VFARRGPGNCAGGAARREQGYLAAVQPVRAIAVDRAARSSCLRMSRLKSTRPRLATHAQRKVGGGCRAATGESGRSTLGLDAFGSETSGGRERWRFSCKGRSLVWYKPETE
jgi:hypothetical protein